MGAFERLIGVAKTGSNAKVNDFNDARSWIEDDPSGCLA